MGDDSLPLPLVNGRAFADERGGPPCPKSCPASTRDAMSMRSGSGDCPNGCPARRQAQFVGASGAFDVATPEPWAGAPSSGNHPSVFRSNGRGAALLLSTATYRRRSPTGTWGKRSQPRYICAGRVPGQELGQAFARVFGHVQPSRPAVGIRADAMPDRPSGRSAAERPLSTGLRCAS